MGVVEAGILNSADLSIVSVKREVAKVIDAQ
jgi:hypothetical protein